MSAVALHAVHTQCNQKNVEWPLANMHCDQFPFPLKLHTGGWVVV